MVDFTLTEEQEALREMAHSFAEKEIRPVAWEYDRDATWPEEIIKGLKRTAAAIRWYVESGLFTACTVSGGLALWFWLAFLAPIQAPSIARIPVAAVAAFLAWAITDRGLYEWLQDYAQAFLPRRSARQIARAPISWDVRHRVWQRDGGACAKCGSEEYLEYDHIVPVVAGGLNTYRNLRLLCQTCNRKKGSSPPTSGELAAITAVGERLRQV